MACSKRCGAHGRVWRGFRGGGVVLRWRLVSTLDLGVLMVAGYRPGVLSHGLSN